MKINILRLISYIALCVSPTASSAQEPPFEVSDVSFLIPPSAVSIHVAGGDGQRPLLSREVFMKFGDFIRRGHPQMGENEVYENLIVTGVRFDPCGPRYPNDWDTEKCALPNLRLIAQVHKDGQLSNSALHMVFLLRPLSDLGVGLQPKVRLNPVMRSDVIFRLKLMKTNNAEYGILTDGAAVGVHPVFGAAYNGSIRVTEFQDELKNLLEEYCVELRYLATAVMFTDEPYGISNSRLERWVWQKGNVDHKPGGKIDLHFGGIPGFPDALKEQTFTAHQGQRSGTAVTPPSTLPKESEGVKNSDIEKILKNAAEINRSDVPAAIDAIDRLENPDLAFVQAEDCVSCHVTTTAREYALNATTVAPWNRKLRYEFKEDSHLTANISESQYFIQGANAYRTMSFAFLDGVPSVSQRTVNESLQAAHVVNLLRR
ncbi:MAG: hypothetical protein U0S49_12515 [Rhodospirillales bacterium]|nr:hypothetical protein [Rhodospirillales bacterium]